MCNITKLRISATFIISHHHHHIRPECLLCFFLLALLLPLHKLFTSHSHTTPTRLPRAEVTREKLVHFHLQTGGGYTAQWESLIVLGGHRIVISHFCGKRSRDFSLISLYYRWGIEFLCMDTSSSHELTLYVI